VLVVVLAAVGAVLLLLAAGWVTLTRGLPGGLAGLDGSEIPVSIGISLTPDATGTVVEVVEESADSALPATLAVDLARADDVTVTQGAAATGKQLRYSDVTDGFGSEMPPQQVRDARLSEVRTDGRRLRLTYHVAAIDGRRIVYPILRTSRITWISARLYVSGGKVNCWGTPSASGAGAFTPCTTSGPDLIDGAKQSVLRLELTS
jgi:hypothetical protein